VDKLPVTPSRLATGPLGGRLAAGAGGAALLARARSAPLLVPALAGAAGAAAGSVVGATWREWATRRGLTWQAALGEDAAALALTVWATRGA
jgi:uncharacterized membrane protein